jgi:SNF2 family DNA or RNA helicase
MWEDAGTRYFVKAFEVRHRALIFTQITKMLDAFKEFINLYGYTYFHLDIAHQSREDEEHKG